MEGSKRIRRGEKTPIHSAGIMWILLLSACMLTLSCEETTGPGDETPTATRKLLIYSDMSSIQANGGSANILVKVYADNDTTNIVSGVRVSFSASLSGQKLVVPAQNDITDARGYARAVLYAGTRSGTASVMASIENFSNTVFVIVTPGAGLVSAEPASILADGQSQSAITATVIDSLGQPLPGARVNFTASAGTITAQSFTDENGRATIMLRSAPSVNDVTSIVTASSSVGKIAVMAPSAPAGETGASGDKDAAAPSSAAKTAGSIGTTSVVFRGVTVSGSLGKSTVFANNADSTTVTVTVKETTSGAPVTGRAVTFSANVGQLRTVQALTDNDGRVQVVFFGGNVSGAPVLTARFADSLAFSSTVTLIKELFMTVEANPAILSANGTDASTVRAYIFDADNNPVQGETVYFRASDGVIQKSAQTNEWGEASVTLRSARYNAVAQVTATYNAISKTTPVRFTGASMNLSASPLVLVADGVSKTRLTAELKDASNLPVVDKSITVTTTLGVLTTLNGASSGTTIADSTSTEGRISAYLSSTHAGRALVIFQASGVSDSLEIDFTDYTFSVTSADAQILSGGSETTLTATLRNKDGVVIPIDPDKIDFSPTLGTIISVSGNTDGSVSAVLRSNNNAGPSTITASISNPAVHASTSVTFVAADVGSIRLEAAKSFVRVGNNTVQVIARVFDVTGNPKSNETVTFAIIGGPGGGERLDSGTAVSNTLGQAIVSFVSGMTGSTQDGVEILARIGNISATVKLTITGQPETVVVGFDTQNYISNNDGTLGFRVSAIVSDVNRNKVVDGTFVDFKIIGDVGVIDQEVQTTNGVASTMLIYASSDAGRSIQVTATSGGKSDTKEVVLPGSTGTVSRISVSAGEPVIAADGVSRSAITISVSGTGGEPINNLMVQCSADIGSIPQTTLTGDPSNPEATPGEAYVSYTSRASKTDELATLRFTAGGVTQTLTIQTRGISLISTAEPDILPSDGQSKSVVSVLVKETTTHIPIVGQTVRFGATDGTIGSSAVTNNNGVATSVFTSGYNAGVTEIYISYGKTLIDTVAVNISEVTARGIELFANPTQIAANGISTSTITALLRDDNFNPVVGEVIRFTTNLGTITAVDSTDQFGRARAILESERRNGQALITARFKEHVSTVPVNFTGVRLNVSATPENLFAGGGDPTIISAYLKDAADVPIVGEDVSFRWYMDNVYQDVLTARTDVQGKASIPLSSDISGQAKIIVNAAGASDSTYVTFTRIRFTMGSNSPSVATGGDDIDVWVQLYDTINERFIRDVTVNFYTTIGEITGSGVTNADGKAYAVMTSGPTAGIATVSASAIIDGSRVSTEMPVPIVNASPAMITLRADANIVAIGGSSSALIAVVTDRFGNPVADNLVSFQIVKGAAGGEYISPPTVTTGTSGTATTYFYSGQIPSQFEGIELKAAVEGIESNIVKLTIAGAPEVVRPSFNADWTLDEINNGDGTYTLPISATVLDINSNGVVDGTTVYFKIEPAEGAVMSPVRTVNSVAVSSITYPSASAGREVKLTASAGGKEGSITFSLPGFIVSYMTLTASPKTILADGKSTTQIKASLFDRTGSSINVPDGTTVSFTTDGGTLDPVVVRTTDGIAITTLTSDRTANRYAVVEAQSGTWTVNTLVWFEEIGSSINQVGDIEVKAFDSLGNENPSIEADGISSARVVAFLKKYNGDPVSAPTTVSFESSIGQITEFVRSDSTGMAVASFSSGEVGTATITASVGNIVGYSSVVVTPGPPRSAELSVNPTSVSVKGAGVNESLVVTAAVKDSKGNPVSDGNRVKFRLMGAYDTGSSLSPEGATQWESMPVPTLNGNATVSFHSGTKAGAVRIQATVVDSTGAPIIPNITSETTQFMVFGGPAYLDMSNVSDPFTNSRMKLYTGPANIYASHIGTEYNRSTVTVTCADRFNNPVPPGTAVYFTTTGGYITNSTGYTDENGMATVTLYSGNPYPTLLNSSSIPNPNYGTRYPGSPSAFTVPRYDFDGNGSDNNGIAVVTAQTEGMDHNGNNVTVWNYTQVIFSLPVYTFTVIADKYTLNIGEVAAITIRIQDANGNPIVKDSEVSISTTKGSLSTASVTTSDPGRTLYTTTLTNDLDPLHDTPGNAVITVRLKSHNGDHTIEIDNPVYLTINAP